VRLVREIPQVSVSKHFSSTPVGEVVEHPNPITRDWMEDFKFNLDSSIITKD
jgi:hypothetical protein